MLGERLGGIDLVSARSTQQRFRVCQVLENELPLLGALAKSIRTPVLDTAENHIGRSAQQDDRIKARVEPALI